MTSARSNYEAAAIEAERRAAWEENGTFEAPAPPQGRRGVYVKPSSPFTSGKLHMGHVRDYSIGDAYARFRRARGDAVLFGFGFVCNRDAMAKHIHADAFYVLRGDIASTFEERVRLCG